MLPLLLSIVNEYINLTATHFQWSISEKLIVAQLLKDSETFEKSGKLNVIKFDVTKVATVADPSGRAV